MKENFIKKEKEYSSNITFKNLLLKEEIEIQNEIENLIEYTAKTLKYKNKKDFLEDVKKMSPSQKNESFVKIFSPKFAEILSKFIKDNLEKRGINSVVKPFYRKNYKIKNDLIEFTGISILLIDPDTKNKMNTYYKRLLKFEEELRDIPWYQKRIDDSIEEIISIYTDVCQVLINTIININTSIEDFKRNFLSYKDKNLSHIVKDIKLLQHSYLEKNNLLNLKNKDDIRKFVEEEIEKTGIYDINVEKIDNEGIKEILKKYYDSKLYNIYLMLYFYLDNILGNELANFVVAIYF